MKQEKEMYTPPLCMVVALCSSGVMLSSSDAVENIEICDQWQWD